MIKLKRGIFDSISSKILFLFIKNKGKAYSSTSVSNFLSPANTTTTVVDNANTGITWVSKVSSPLYVNKPFIGWTSVSGVTGNLNDSLYANGLFVVAGVNGYITTSPDGSTWTARAVAGNTTFDFNAVAYGNGTWIAVGQSGTTAKSTNGINWVSVTTALGVTANASQYGNGLWVIGGQSGIMKTSTDASTWTTVTSTFGATVYNIAYANGIWVATSISGRIAGSTNGSVWATANSTFGTTSVYAISYGNGFWVAVGETGQMRSGITTNGVSWTWTTINSILTGNVNAITYADGIWVAGASSGQVATSTDSVSWALNNYIVGYPQIVAIAYGSGKWVLSTLSNSLGSLQFNTKRTGNQITAMKSFSYGNGIWVGVGSYGQLINSTDTISWTTNNYHPDENIFNSLDFNQNDSFVAVGNSGKIFQSTDAINWVSRNSFTTQNLNKVIYNKNTETWLAVGDAGVLRSSNEGQTWATAATPSVSGFNADSITSVTYGRVWGTNQFAAISNAQLRTSTNGGTWVAQSPSLGSNILSIASSDSLFVIGGTSGNMKFSTDLVNWTTVTNNFYPLDVNYITYQNNLWAVHLGTKPLDPPNTGSLTYSNQIRISTDLIAWITANTSLGSSIYSLGFANNNWIASGANGLLSMSSQAYKSSSTDYLLSGNIVDTDYALNNWTAATWTSVNSTFGTTNINSIAYADNMWVAAGNNGQIRYSTDALTWSTATSNTGVTLNYVNKINGLWTAAGGTGNLLLSTNAISWTAQTTGITSNLIKVIYANGTFFAIENSGLSTNILSKKGYYWNLVNSAGNFAPSSNNLGTIDYLNGTWFIGAQNSSYISTDTFAWTVGTDFGASVSRSKVANNLIAAGTISGGLYMSTDAISWRNTNARLAGQSVNGIEYANGLWFIATGSNIINLSTDTITWITKGISMTQTGVAYGNGTWVVVGPTGQMQKRSDTYKTTAVNINEIDYFASAPSKTDPTYDTVNTGITWTTVNFATASTSVDGNWGIQKIIYGNQLWIAANYHKTVFTSTDATTWVSNQINFTNDELSAIEYGQGKWIVGNTNGEMRSSTNGSIWTTVNYPNISTNAIITISYGNGLWAAAGYSSNYMYLSTDAINWTINSSVNYNFKKIIYNNLWVGITFEGNLKTSTDTITWISQNIGNTQTGRIGNIIYGNNLWILMMNNGWGTKNSTDTINWTTITNLATNTFYSGVYANNLWILKSYNNVYRSTDTLNWSTNLQNNFYAQQINYANEKWVAGGNYSNIYNSTQLYNYITTASVYWTAGASGSLYSSTDTINWVTNSSPTVFTNSDLNTIQYDGTETHKGYLVGGV